MASTLDIDSGPTGPGLPESEEIRPPSRFSRALKAYAFLVAVILGLLLGVGLRFVPATAAATPDDSAGAGAASTACAAQ
jgi:hypothetical protein